MKIILGWLLITLFAGPLIAQEGTVLNVRWLTSSTTESPKLVLKIENHTKRAISVQGYHGRPMVTLDFWYDFEGLVLIDASQYRVTMGGFVVLEPVVVPAEGSVSFELDLITFVPFAGEYRGTSGWLTDFANAQAPRVVARVKIDGIECFSNYAFLHPAAADQKNTEKSAK